MPTQRQKLFSFVVVKPEGKGPLGGPGSGWEDDDGMNLREIGCGGVDWWHLTQDVDQ
jgi:hypothetical protein